MVLRAKGEINVSIPYRYATNIHAHKVNIVQSRKFQSLIGTLQTWTFLFRLSGRKRVSIPYRYATNPSTFTSLMSTSPVSIPYRYATNEREIDLSDYAPDSFNPL